MYIYCNISFIFSDTLIIDLDDDTLPSDIDPCLFCKYFALPLFPAFYYSVLALVDILTGVRSQCSEKNIGYQKWEVIQKEGYVRCNEKKIAMVSPLERLFMDLIFQMEEYGGALSAGARADRLSASRGVPLGK